MACGLNVIACIVLDFGATYFQGLPFASLCRIADFLAMVYGSEYEFDSAWNCMCYMVIDFSDAVSCLVVSQVLDNESEY